MAANNYFQEYLVFRTRDLDADRVPRRCVVCEVNPSSLRIRKAYGFWLCAQGERLLLHVLRFQHACEARQ